MDGIIGTNQEVGTGRREPARRGQHQIADALQVAVVEAPRVVGQGIGMDRHLRVGVPPH